MAKREDGRIAGVPTQRREDAKFFANKTLAALRLCVEIQKDGSDTDQTCHASGCAADPDVHPRACDLREACARGRGYRGGHARSALRRAARDRSGHCQPGRRACRVRAVFPTFSTFLGKPGLYLEDLYVRPAARGFGVGRKLLEHLARITVERGWGRLEWSVLDWNEPSIAFYKKMGAKPMDEWTIFRLTGDSLHRLAQNS